MLLEIGPALYDPPQTTHVVVPTVPDIAGGIRYLKDTSTPGEPNMA